MLTQTRLLSARGDPGQTVSAAFTALVYGGSAISPCAPSHCSPHPPVKLQAVRTVPLEAFSNKQECQSKQNQMRVREQFDEAFDLSQHFFGPGGPEPHALLQSADQCSNKTHHPRPPFLFHGFCSHFSFFPQITWQLPPFACGLMNTFSVFSWIYSCVCWGGARVLGGVSDSLPGTSLLVVARVTHWSLQPLAECCRASLAPKLKATTSKANQTPPLVSAGKWQAGTFCPAAIHN